MLKAGVAIREITPIHKLAMAGYPGNRCGMMAHDPLYTSAFYLENEETRILFLTADLIGLTNDRANETRMLIEKHTGISRENIMIVCSHTHSGPITGGLDWEGPQGKNELYPENNDRIRDKMLEAAKEAVANVFEAKIGWGKCNCGKEKGIGGNRHDPENGPVDPSVNVVAIAELEGEIRGCIVDYALHSTVLHDDNMLYTADYPAYIRQTLNKEYPYMVFGFMEGPNGDQSTRFFRQGQDFKEAERVGGTIGEAALQVLKEMKYETEAVLKCKSVKFVPPIKEFPTYEEAQEILAQSQKVYEELVAAGAPYREVRAAQSIMEGSLGMASMTANLAGMTIEEFLKPSLPIECHAMRIGQCCILGLGGECFVGISNAIKEASPYEMTFISCVTNGMAAGYLCTDEAYGKLCYEAQNSPFTKGTEQAVVKSALEAIVMTR